MTFNITLTFGWWLLPTLLNVAWVFISRHIIYRNGPVSFVGDFFWLLIFLVPSLLLWLIYLAVLLAVE